jgi:hypothetical protein
MDIASEMENLQRWDIYIAGEGGFTCIEHDPDSDGDWVKWDDVQAIIDKLKKEE